MMLTKNTLIGMSVVLLVIIGSGCLTTAQEDETVTSLLPETVQAQASEPVRVSGQNPTTSPETLRSDYVSASDEICRECHLRPFTSISMEGGKHDLGCTFCHVQHGIKPECSVCHDLAHGAQLKDCKDCHDEHSPMEITSNLDFDQSCSNCHAQQTQEFKDHPGKHGNLECSFCHNTHRYIEACTNCHAPHGTWLPYTECLNCHPAHMPQEINYPDVIAGETCAFCHEMVSDVLDDGNTKHTDVGCSGCHPVHEQIPECMDCHTSHTTDMAYENCTACHQAHDPLIMEFPEGTKQDICEICHEEINSVLNASNTKHDDLGCVYCHPDHRYVPTCESCHGLQHDRIRIHEDFPECMQCHIVSHDVKVIVIDK